MKRLIKVKVNLEFVAYVEDEKETMQFFSDALKKEDAVKISEVKDMLDLPPGYWHNTIPYGETTMGTAQILELMKEKEKKAEDLFDIF